MNKHTFRASLLIFCGLLIQQTASAGWVLDQLNYFSERSEAQKEIEQAQTCALSAEEAYDRSIELLSDGCQSEAEDLIASAIKRYPDNPELLFAHAVLERSRWYKDEAAVWLKILQKKKAPDYLKEAAKLNISLDHEKDTAANMEQLLQLSDEHPENLYLLWLSAIQCRNKKMGATAKDRYERLLEKFTLGPVMLHHTYANILTEDLQEYDEALRHRYIAISMEPKDWTLQGLGNTLYYMGEYERANATFSRLIRMNPHNATYLNRRGDTLMELARYEEATELYRRKIELDPDKYVWDDLSRALYNQGQYQEGVSAADEALKLDPEYGWAWGRKGINLEKLKRYKEAAECYHKALEYGQYWVADDLGNLYIHGLGVEKDGAKAIQYLTLSTKKYPHSAWAFERLGHCYFEGIGSAVDEKRALRYFKQALAINPKNENSLNGLAWFYATSKDESLRNYPKAVQLAEQAVAIQPTLYNQDTLIVAYQRNGQIEKAITAQNNLIDYLHKQNPDHVPDEQITRLAQLKEQPNNSN